MVLCFFFVWNPLETIPIPNKKSVIIPNNMGISVKFHFIENKIMMGIIDSRRHVSQHDCPAFWQMEFRPGRGDVFGGSWLSALPSISPLPLSPPSQGHYCCMHTAWHLHVSLRRNPSFLNAIIISEGVHSRRCQNGTNGEYRSRDRA